MFISRGIAPLNQPPGLRQPYVNRRLLPIRRDRQVDALSAPCLCSHDHGGIICNYLGRMQRFRMQVIAKSHRALIYPSKADDMETNLYVIKR